MKDYVAEYYQSIASRLQRICEEQKENIAKAAQLMARKISEDGVIHVFGTGGHSNMMAEEMFNRAGGLACISPLFADTPPAMAIFLIPVCFDAATSFSVRIEITVYWNEAQISFIFFEIKSGSVFI